MRATRTDVARLARVSTTTVSNCLNNKSNVSERTRQRVLRAIAELDYKPNLVARSLITNRSNHVVTLLDDISDPHHGAILEAFQRRAVETGYFMSIYIRTRNLSLIFDDIIARKIDGVFLMISPEKFEGDEDTVTEIRKLAEAGVKVVAGFDCQCGYNEFSMVVSDFGEAVAKSVDYLASLGHTQIGLLNIFDEDYVFDNRCLSFKKQMKKRFGNERPAVILGRPPYLAHIDTGEAYTERLLRQNPETTAIICTNDLLAIGCVNYLTGHGYRVPDDVSVIAIGDVPLLKYFKPSITAMGIDHAGYGEAAFNVLLEAIETGNTHFSSYKLTLHPRQSTARARGERLAAR